MKPRSWVIFPKLQKVGLEAGISAGKAEEFIENIKNTVEKKLGKYF